MSFHLSLEEVLQNYWTSTAVETLIAVRTRQELCFKSFKSAPRLLLTGEAYLPGDAFYDPYMFTWTTLPALAAGSVREWTFPIVRLQEAV